MGKAHVLAICVPAQGHVIPLMELSVSLAKHGIKITFVNSESAHKLVVNASPAATKDDDDIALVSIPDGDHPEILKQVIENINATAGSDKITCVLADPGLSWAMEVAQEMKIRRAILSPFAATLLVLKSSIPKLIQDGIIRKDGFNRDEGGLIARQEIQNKLEELLGNEKYRANALDIKEKLRNSIKQENLRRSFEDSFEMVDSNESSGTPDGNAPSETLHSMNSHDRFNYSKEFLRWALRLPGYFKSWHIGVRVKSSKKLVAFITGVPARIWVHDEIFLMAEVNFLCIHKKLISKRLAPVMIKEVTRRVHLENIWQAAYTAGVVLPTPMSTCQYWHRSLNPKKLIDVGFSRLGARMTMSRTIKLFKLPDSTVTPGFRKMELHDVPTVTRLLRNYLSQFIVAPDFDENDVEHWLLPKEDVVDSFLVESPETHEITDFCSFYTLHSSILGNPNHSTLKVAYSYYNVSTKTPLLQLMNDVLIVAKQKGFDVFNALDVMQNETFVKELKFGPGDGKLHYYLYNYRIKHAMRSSELGLVLL
ncbi:hypothetical protein Q3G72_031532 [Acer saccharum]|nr:hypothetical protein Q3G72_031532 [Acer saccharum]